MKTSQNRRGVYAVGMERSGTEPAPVISTLLNGCWVSPCGEGEALFSGCHDLLQKKATFLSPIEYIL
jgi:hypothetical protein